MKRYTVKKVAELSGVSVRTLHFYDEIGLLKPAVVGENGYRYYERAQLLLLQQILFYKQLGLPLDQIQAIVGNPTFDKVSALKTHRARLARDSAHLKKLVRTIDRTLEELEGKTKVDDEGLYYGFAPEKQAEYERYIVDRYGKAAERNIAESKERLKGWSRERFERINAEGAGVLKELVARIESGENADSPGVQDLIARHHRWVSHFWTPNREAYTGLGRLYTEHPDFRKFYEPYHPRLADFLCEAMRVYAEARLT